MMFRRALAILAPVLFAQPALAVTPWAAASGSVASSLVQPVNNGARVAAASLSGSLNSSTAFSTAHPFLLSNQARWIQYLTDAFATQSGAAGGKFQALIRLQAAVNQMVGSAATSGILTQLETPSTFLTGANDANINVYMNQFSVFNPNSSLAVGASGWAQSLALYSYLITLTNANFASTNTGAWNSSTYSGLAATAKTAANTILYNWASQAFTTSAGDLITDYSQYTQEMCVTTVTTTSTGAVVSTSKAVLEQTGLTDGTTSSVSGSQTSTVVCKEYPMTASVGQGVALQVGRGLRNAVEAADWLDDGTMPDRALIVGWLRNMENMLVTAANFKFANTNTYRCGRFDNQQSNTVATLSMLARETGDSELLEELAGDPAAQQKRLWFSFPQQIQGTIYGSNDSAINCLPANNGGSTQVYFFQPYVALGELADRFRMPSGDDFGYPSGNLMSLMIAAKQMSDAGYSPYTYVAPNGSSLEAGVDYYSNFVTKYSFIPIVLTGSISGTTLTITAAAGSPIQVGMSVTAYGSGTTALAAGTVVTAFGTGTGGTGTYTVSDTASTSQTIASEGMTAGLNYLIPKTVTAATQTIQDEPYYVGSRWSGAAIGGEIMGADGRWDETAVGAAAWPSDTIISGAMATVNADSTAAFQAGSELALESYSMTPP